MNRDHVNPWNQHRPRRGIRRGRRGPVAAAVGAIAASAATAAAQQGCGEWTFVDAPPDTLAVTDVEARSADDAWAFGYYHGLIHWDGTSWTPFPTEFLCGDYDWFETLLFQVLHPDELDLPDRPNVRFVDMETSRTIVAEPRVIQKEYKAELQKFLDEIRNGCEARRIDYNLVSTATPYFVGLERYLVKRTRLLR